MNIYIKNHCIVWGALTEAYHGINNYGKNIAQIDAKYFLPNPYLEPKNINAEDYLEAGRNLIELCRTFSKVYLCKVLVDSIDCWEFSEILLDTKANVKVEMYTKK